MAAKNYKPLRPTTTTGSDVTAVNHDYTVTAGKRWLFDVIELQFGTQVAGNTCTIEHPVGTAIWPVLSNFTNLAPYLGSLYPRALELEAGAVLRIAWVRASGATTVTSTVSILERDL